MSTFENDQYRWRETYFVLFDVARRPMLKVVQRRLAELNRRFATTNARGDAKGHFESITVLSPDDFAALDICYVEGEEVQEQAQAMIREMTVGEGGEEAGKIARLEKYTGRFDILHFEQVTDSATGDDADEMLDPSALLIVLDTLVALTGGVAVDPQSGTTV